MTEPYPTDIADWPSATLTAVCRTPGCRAEGVAFEGVYFENPEPPLYRGQCGQCEQPITDLRNSSTPPPG
ncbi:hypothetical protein ACFWWT_26500 [Streptomyces sp. NPDC058676]|uniref:hypothetical protein n=1 Tax=unclassified Streptomyces TaxID=2593676 RepID=UPI00365D2CC8